MIEKNIQNLTFLNKAVIQICVLLLMSIFSVTAQAVRLADHPKLQIIADELITENYYTEAELEAVMAGATIQQSILDAMINPAEYKFTWGKYRKLFIQPDRTERAVEFWQEHQTTLDKAEQEYGVPASIIVAIIGVESKFGQYKGKYKVIDSLVSLVVGYPRRSAFFAKELKHFLILTKENQLDSLALLGSYAGAVGYPQFIASSYRTYAVDFSGDGVIDLIDQPIDAIGSVANYFKKNGWLNGKPVTSVAHLQLNSKLIELANNKRKVQFTAASLREMGAPISEAIDDQEKLNVLMLDASEVMSEPAKSKRYTVRAGDTTCQIAERFSVKCKDLFTLNKLNSRGAIYRGQRLKLPSNNGDKLVMESSTIQPRYFFTHENFYVITRYNHSVLYAMAVNDLSNAVEQEKNNQDNNGLVK